MGEETASDDAKIRFPIVGLGASAGGLDALQKFFGEVPVDSGAAYVVITHLHPDNPSMMPELIRSHCRIPVQEIVEPTTVQPNHVYVAGPRHQMTIEDGRLTPIEGDTHRRIDFFFRALAKDQRTYAVGVVLSGTGTDGSLGLKEIKGASGMVMAQEEASAEFAGMPHSAIGTRLVDYVASAEELPAKLARYLATFTGERQGDVDFDEERLIALLREHVGHDFSEYKLTTVRRRVERRMHVHHLQSVAEYVTFVENTPNELDELFNELLIGVTSFFRDPESFESLRTNVLAKIVADCPEGQVIRVWVPACSTGEEAYSLAILLREEMRAQSRHRDAQIFATDLDARAITFARVGLYPESIAVDVDEERLERFFERQERGFRVRKDIREMLVFAPQNLLADPPFTKLNLLACRNLLIYLEPKLQRRLLPIFHYALAPNGALFLGSSETIGHFGSLFDAIDKKMRIFVKRDVAPGSYTPDFPSGGRIERYHPVIGGQGASPGDAATRVRRSIEQVLLKHLAPPSLLIHESGDVVHVHGRTGHVLEPAEGAQTRVNVFNMAREGLDLDLASAIREAATAGEASRRGVRVQSNGGHIFVDIGVERLREPEGLRGLFLVSFADAQPSATSTVDDAASEDGRVRALSLELKHARDVHQRMMEELGAANEEFKSTNEELQSTNEELQSANEELETSKEEMQSLNEELQTVNLELQHKVEELSRTTDDMKNLLNGTDIATLFLDADLCIKRFTDQTKSVIRLIPSDVGRAIGDLVSDIQYEDLASDAREVLRTLVPREVEVRSVDGTWYLMRVLPYRTTENVNDGVVITFVNVGAVKQAQQRERRMIDALEGSATTAFGQDSNLQYTWVAHELLGRSSESVVGTTDADFMDPEDAETLNRLKRKVLEDGKPSRGRVDLSNGSSRVAYDVYIAPVRQPDGVITGISGIITEIGVDVG